MPSLSLASSPAAVRAAIRVDKATSELLVGPDWTMNIEICDFCNSNHWQAKDVVKEVRRRLQHKNSKIQLLTLTLLETMVKNCGEYIHKHIGDRKVLDEMIKIVKKKADIHVRDKILVLLNSWQEAFGGPNGRNSQYYWACDELRRCGIEFPKRPNRSAPIITPPPTHPPRARIGSDVSRSSSRRLDEGTSSEAEGELSDSILRSMHNVVEVLDDMVQVMNPNDRKAAREEVISELAERCRSDQKKLTQILTTTTDEELLGRGLEMNEWLQSVLTMYDAIASGGPIPVPKLKKSLSKNIRAGCDSVKSKLKITESTDKNYVPNRNGNEYIVGNANGNSSSTSGASVITKDRRNQDEEKEDEFSQLVQRHSKASPESAVTGTTEDGESSSGSNCNALVVIDDPTGTVAQAADVTANTKEQDLIDLLSIVLTTSSTSEETTQAPDTASVEEPTFEASFSTYIVPWAQSQSQFQAQQFRSPNQFQAQYPNVHSLITPQSHQLNYSQYSPNHYHPTPCPWDLTTSNYTNYQPQIPNIYAYPTTPGHINGSLIPPIWQSPNNSNNITYSTTTQITSNSSSSIQDFRAFHNVNSFQNPPCMPMQGVNVFSQGTTDGTSLNGNVLVTSGSSIVPGGQKQCVPSYKLFDDINVFGNSEGKIKSGSYSSPSGNYCQHIFTGRKQ